MNAPSQQRIRKYLDKRADLKTRPLVCDSYEGVDCVVVIPVLAESDHLFRTLESLTQNSSEDLRNTLVVCVVNNRAKPFADPIQVEDNSDTLARLDEFALHPQGESPLRPPVQPALTAPTAESRFSDLRLGYVDASSSGNELPEKGGVGLARKIGLDWGLAVLAETGHGNGLLLSLDADTLVEPNYLAAVREHFASTDPWAAVMAYAHLLDGPPEKVAAIVCYEIFLRYHVLGLQYARSPYAFPTIGSTMACTTQAYAAVSGMNQRQAGEDFYFLQQLAKTGHVDPIHTTTVYPSSRPSPRVPFGTGQRIRRHLAGVHDEYVLYDPECYRILKEWLACATTHADSDATHLLAQAETISPTLRSFLEAQGFADTWPRLQANSPDPAQRRGQFHCWFDGFKTLKLIHYLRDHGHPQRDMFDAVFDLLERRNAAPSSSDFADIRTNLQTQTALLHHLRRCSYATTH